MRSLRFFTLMPRLPVSKLARGRAVSEHVPVVPPPPPPPSGPVPPVGGRGVISKPSSSAAFSDPVVTFRSRNPSGASPAIFSRATAAVGLVTVVERTWTPVPDNEVSELDGANAVFAPVSATSTVDPRTADLGLASVSRATGGGAPVTRNGPGTLSFATSPPVCTVTSRKPIVAPEPTVTLATADVGEVTVRPFTVTPAPSPATLTPPAKCVRPPEIVTSRVAPTGTIDGVTDRTVGADGGATTCTAPMPFAVSNEPSPRSVLTVTSRNPTGAAPAAVTFTTI